MTDLSKAGGKMRYKCPQCQQEVMSVILPTYPPKSQFQCFHCGWKGEIKSSQDDWFVEAK